MAAAATVGFRRQGVERRWLLGDAETFGGGLVDARLPRREPVKRRRGRFAVVVEIGIVADAAAGAALVRVAGGSVAPRKLLFAGRVDLGVVVHLVRHQFRSHLISNRKTR